MNCHFFEKLLNIIPVNMLLTTVDYFLFLLHFQAIIILISCLYVSENFKKLKKQKKLRKVIPLFTLHHKYHY